MSEGAVDFMNKILRLNPADRPSAIQLMGHPWVQMASLIPSHGLQQSMESTRTSQSEDITYTECF